MWMDLEIVTLSEVRQRRHISYDIPYMWNLNRNDTNEFMYRTKRDSQIRGFGRGMYRLLCLKWIPNKDLPYSTWNSD